MHVAAKNGHVAVVKTLVRLGSAAVSRPTKYGSKPMHLAAASGHADIVETLHRLGSRAINSLDDSGWTPMSLAARFGHAHVVETMIRIDAAQALAHDGTYPLLMALRRKHTAVAELLLAAGADAAALADHCPEQMRALLATPAEQLLALRRRLFFSSTLLDVLLRKTPTI